MTCSCCYSNEDFVQPLWSTFSSRLLQNVGTLFSSQIKIGQVVYDILNTDPILENHSNHES